jgi:hypothetical protein
MNNNVMLKSPVRPEPVEGLGIHSAYFKVVTIHGSTLPLVLSAVEGSPQTVKWFDLERA